MKRLKVAIADDHKIILIGIREVIERDLRFSVVGEATSSSELMRVLEGCTPDILILDYSMPGDASHGDGLSFVEYLCRNFKETKVLIFTMMSNPLVLSRLYDVGVAGVVLKSGECNELITALSTVSRGHIYRGAVWRSKNSIVKINDDLLDRISSLSLRELEVLRDFTAGLSPAEIAVKQKKSVKTISAQKISAMRKLKAENDQVLLSCCLQARLFE